MENHFYISERYYLLIYETTDKAAEATTHDDASAVDAFLVDALPWAKKLTNYWARKLNSRVTYSEPNEPIMLIKKSGLFWNVIVGEKIGWYSRKRGSE